MSKSLRPETLFNPTKFETYLQELGDNGKAPESDDPYLGWPQSWMCAVCGQPHENRVGEPRTCQTAVKEA
jgi:hypothetical protein